MFFHWEHSLAKTKMFNAQIEEAGSAVYTDLCRQQNINHGRLEERSHCRPYDSTKNHWKTKGLPKDSTSDNILHLQNRQKAVLCPCSHIWEHCPLARTNTFTAIIYNRTWISVANYKSHCSLPNLMHLKTLLSTKPTGFHWINWTRGQTPFKSAWL